MKLISISTCLLFGVSTSLANAADLPSPIGYWTTGKGQAVVQIYNCGGDMLCGAFVGFPMNHNTDPIPKTWNDRSQCRFVFIRYLRPHGDSRRGTIINPKTGGTYRVDVKMTKYDTLRLHGYLLFGALGSTRTWTRYGGSPPAADCRMPPHSLN